MDLADGGLIVDCANASAAANVLATLNQKLALANGAAGLWKGAGLTSSTARNRADQITGLAAIVNNDAGQPIVTNFGDQHPGLTSVLVKYTYNGDSDLNEQVDAFDYFHIDQGYRLQGDPTYRNYRSGDVNYSGAIDADDYYLIDRAFIHQSVLSRPAFPSRRCKRPPLRRRANPRLPNRRLRSHRRTRLRPQPLRVP